MNAIFMVGYSVRGGQAQAYIYSSLGFPFYPDNSMVRNCVARKNNVLKSTINWNRCSYGRRISSTPAAIVSRYYKYQSKYFIVGANQLVILI
jgi:hypothetical protein